MKNKGSKKEDFWPVVLALFAAGTVMFFLILPFGALLIFSALILALKLLDKPSRPKITTLDSS